MLSVNKPLVSRWQFILSEGAILKLTGGTNIIPERRFYFKDCVRFRTLIIIVQLFLQFFIHFCHKIERLLSHFLSSVFPTPTQNQGEVKTGKGKREKKQVSKNFHPLFFVENRQHQDGLASLPSQLLTGCLYIGRTAHNRFLDYFDVVLVDPFLSERHSSRVKCLYVDEEKR